MMRSARLSRPHMAKAPLLDAHYSCSLLPEFGPHCRPRTQRQRVAPSAGAFGATAGQSVKLIRLLFSIPVQSLNFQLLSSDLVFDRFDTIRAFFPNDHFFDNS